jgi:hypothetical protein
MKHVLIAALVALFALSFTMAQDQPAKKEKSTETSSTSTAKTTGDCSSSKSCCAGSNKSANMKDCPMMKGTTEAKTSSQTSTVNKAETKTTETKAVETK